MSGSDPDLMLWNYSTDSNISAEGLFLLASGSNDTRSASTSVTASGSAASSARSTPISYRSLRESYIVISSVGILLNLGVVYVLSRSYRKLNSHSLLVLNQCCCETLICLFTILENIVRFYDRFYLNQQIVCLLLVTTMIRLLSFVVTFLNMIVITLARFIAVYRPNQYNALFSRIRTSTAIGIMYFLVLVLMCLQCVYTGHKYASNRSRTFCFTYFVHGGPNVVDISLACLVFSLFVLLPCVYAYIIVSAQRRKSISERGRAKAATSNITMTSLCIVTAFVVCVTAHTVVRVITRFGIKHLSPTGQNHLLAVSVYLGLFVILNCVVDPVIYAFRLPSIRQGIGSFWIALPFNNPPRVRCNRTRDTTDTTWN